MFHCVHFECPADSSALEEHERSRGLEAVNLSLSATTSTRSQRRDDADVSSDPEDDAARPHHVAGNNDLPEGHVLRYQGAAAAAAGGAIGHDVAQLPAFQYEPAIALGAPAVVVPYGAGLGAVAGQLRENAARLQPQQLGAVDRGDGFGVEASPEAQRRESDNGASSPAHSD